ncbi:MAG TPA: hypothetical protein VF977_02385, partial [Candidatus Binatia bacterium]
SFHQPRGGAEGVAGEGVAAVDTVDEFDPFASPKTTAYSPTLLVLHVRPAPFAMTEGQNFYLALTKIALPP